MFEAEGAWEQKHSGVRAFAMQKHLGERASGVKDIWRLERFGVKVFWGEGLSAVVSSRLPPPVPTLALRCGSRTPGAGAASSPPSSPRRPVRGLSLPRSRASRTGRGSGRVPHRRAEQSRSHPPTPAGPGSCLRPARAPRQRAGGGRGGAGRGGGAASQRRAP